MTKAYCTQLSNRTVIAVKGPDSAAFLQGLITNDINKATKESLVYSCFLTPQGKFLFDFFILKIEDGYLFDVEAGRHKEFLMRLTMFKLRADVMLVDLSDQYQVYAAWGGNISDGYSDPRHPKLGHRIIQPISDSLALDLEGVDFDMYDYHRLLLGVSDGSRDMIPERSGMLESNMDVFNALDWDKGCYMGQELTARTHYRGLVKRRLIPFTYEDHAPEFGAVITAGDEKIGEVRSTCMGAGLALAKVEQANMAIKKETQIKAGGVIIKLSYSSSSA